MKSELVISLRNWPKQTIIDKPFKVSPTSLEVIKKAGLTVDSVTPLTLDQFSIRNDYRDKGKKEIKNMHEEELKRRKLKVKILKDLWKRFHQERQQQKFKANKKIQRKTRKSSLRQSSKSSQTMSLKKVPTLHRPFLDKNKTQYSNINSLASLSYRPELQKKPKIKKKTEFTTEYFQQLEESKQNKIYCLLRKMTTTMNTWTNLDQKHHEQMKEMRNLSERERKRLLKIHCIEKQRLKEEVEQIRLQLE